MKRFALLFLWTSTAWAGNLCYTSSATEDAILADAAAREGFTVQQEINQTMSSMIASKYTGAVGGSVGNALITMWPTLSAARKTNICTQLSVSPCPP